MKTTTICIGEIVIDWIRATANGVGNSSDVFERHLAGVPVNVAVALSRQYYSTAMIGRVGDDPLGRWAQDVLSQEGVRTSGVVIDRDAVTRTVMVERQLNGERFALGMNKVACADQRLCPDDVDEMLYYSAAGLYIGSTVFASEPTASAGRRALTLAAQYDLLVVCDANIWPAMWSSKAACLKAMSELLPKLDVFKVSEWELEYLTGQKTMESAMRMRADSGLPLLVVTRAEKGAWVVTASGCEVVPTYDVEVKEPAGAGDAFVATLIAGLLPMLTAKGPRRELLNGMLVSAIVRVVKRANAAGALVAGRLGAACAMPTANELDEFIQQRERGTA